MAGHQLQTLFVHMEVILAAETVRVVAGVGTETLDQPDSHFSQTGHAHQFLELGPAGRGEVHLLEEEGLFA